MRCDESGKPVERVRYFPDGSKATMDPETGEVRLRLARQEALPKVKSHRVKLVPGAPEAVETLRRIFRMARVLGFVQIADALNRAGIPGPRGNRWAGSSIRDILKNVAYKGALHYGKTFKAKYHRVCRDQPREFGFLEEGQLNQGDVPEEEWYVEPEWNGALIAPDEFDEVRAAMAVRSHRAARSPRSGNHPYLLSGIARCARCGSPLQGHTQRGKNGQAYYRYTCATARKYGSSQCARYSLDAAGLEAYVLKELRKCLDTDCARESLRMGLERILDERSKGTERLEAAQREIKALAAKKSALFKTLTPDNLEMFQSEIDKLTAEENA
jgi:ribosomal protein L34E